MLTTEQLSQVNAGYSANYRRWDYLARSYEGGMTYTQGGYLRKYINEDSGPGDQYVQRLISTALDNHVRAVIDTYRSYLFKTEPTRISQAAEREDIAEFIRDCDLDGMDLTAFMKNLNDCASIFGSAWVLVDKPAYKAQTLAEEQALGIRPYATMYAPTMVLDWRYERDIAGRQQLVYVKIIEESNINYDIIKIWTPERVESYRVTKSHIVRKQNIYPNASQMDSTSSYSNYEKIISMEEYINPLGYIPMFCYQLGYTNWKGVGSSEVSDIADAQRMIYNLCSEMEQNIRISSSPSLVKTADTDAAGGAGSIITMPEHLTGDMKPYLLQPSGATVDSILQAIGHHIESINRMAHLSSVRATVQSTRSGIAIEAEFMLLNSKLADRAGSLKDAEYKIWNLYFAWMGEGMPEEFGVEYETSFSLRDTQRELEQIKIGMELVTDPVYAVKAKKAVAELTLGDDADIQEVWASIDAGAEMSKSEESEEYEESEEEEESDMEETGDSCPIETQDIAANLANRQTAIDLANYGPLNPALPNRVFWATKADMWKVDVATAKSSLCSNCAAFNQTSRILDCIDTGLAAGGSGTADAWDTIAAGNLGYCEAWDFKCAGSRTCDGWIAGGPIVD